MQTWQVILLGVIEGLTEFLPVSSTGHLLLVGHFLGFHSPGRAFEVLIQLGAILAVLTVYSAKLLQLVRDLPRSVRARRFVLAVLAATLPAAVVGVVGHRYIKSVLFETPWLICTTLVAGGIILLMVDRLRLKPRHWEVMDYPIAMAFIIGLCQTLAMVPGVSRSGATVVGALLLGADKRSATEFSFYLAMPTMTGAFIYDLYKSYGELSLDDLTGIGLGFATSFIAGAIVVRYLLGFVSRHGFTPFAWWRIIVGGMGMGALAVLG